MPFSTDRWEHLTGQVIGTGHCVPLIREATGAPITTQWRRGARVQDVPDLAPGTVIATFHGDRYANKEDGSSHAALFLRHEERGAIRVFDQWRIDPERRHPASERTIREKHGAGPASDDAGRYFIVETA